MQRGMYESRAYATLLLKNILEVADPMHIMNLKPLVFTEVSDRISDKATKAALHILVNICPWGRNRHKTVEAGAISVMIELLMDEITHSKIDNVGSNLALLSLNLNAPYKIHSIHME
ncbi:hypothetical protein Bca4012_081936 [Brassica carinata]|uniref:U-box domain-containing protein n=1 Tax=Brassica carinata TaxID=52824 RepID=A0A8X7VD93_BRACI|nr:hypothetical protein Bca52824_028894 [Brassica carinata]